MAGKCLSALFASHLAFLRFAYQVRPGVPVSATEGGRCRKFYILLSLACRLKRKQNLSKPDMYVDSLHMYGRDSYCKF